MHSAAASRTVGLDPMDVNKEKRVRDEVLGQAVDGRSIIIIEYYFYLLD